MTSIGSLARSIAVAAMIAGAALLPQAAAAAPALRLQAVVSGLNSPLGLTHAGDGSGRLFVVEQGGRIRIISGGSVRTTPFLDISAKVSSGGERGLLGLAFDVHYPTNGFFYVFYTAATSGTVTIARYSVSADPNVANTGSELVLKTQAHAAFSNHNGGSLLFGPDGCLYAGIGDGGSGGDPDNNGQNLATLLGKIIRIDPATGAPCAVAPENPFVRTQGARGEIWALGLRNPWRMTFDRLTDDLIIADVGQGSREEIDVQPPGIGGRNYCWRRKEGTLIFDASVPCTAGTPTDPVLEYDHSGGNCSITGGYRYRGAAFPSLYGLYFYADYCSGRIWAASESAGHWSTRQRLDTTLNITSFGEDEEGELYVVAQSGTIYRIVAPAATHDFNGEFKSDIAWRQDGTGAIAVWLMNGAQVAAAASLGVAASSWQIMGQRDFDGDGKDDLLWHNTSTGGTAIWFMNGASVSAATAVGAVSGTWSIVGTGDLNGDGKGDILWRDGGGNLAAWLMTGASFLSGAGLGNVPPAWTVAAFADFDGDGKADILWRDASGNVAIWFMNGTSLASAVFVATVGAPWSISATGDFNGDGKADIVWRDTSGNTAIWLMDGAAVTASVGLGAIPPAWIIAQTGDYDGNGKADILWRNTSTGDIALWFMNGANVGSAASVATVPANWTIESVNAN